MYDLNDKNIHPDVKAIIEHFEFEVMPVEGTLYKSTYRSPQRLANGGPAGTAMIGLYCNHPFSASCFHKLSSDEVWHAYGGDPFILVQLNQDGSSEQILMGNRPDRGQRIQYTVPANTWQAGYLGEGGRYALFGCTMAPGFRGQDFIAGTAEELVALYPEQETIIRKLSANGQTTAMPAGFEEG